MPWIPMNSGEPPNATRHTESIEKLTADISDLSPEQWVGLREQTRDLERDYLPTRSLFRAYEQPIGVTACALRAVLISVQAAADRRAGVDRVRFRPIAVTRSVYRGLGPRMPVPTRITSTRPWSGRGQPQPPCNINLGKGNGRSLAEIPA